jgi:hypothetical protein
LYLYFGKIMKSYFKTIVVLIFFSFLVLSTGCRKKTSQQYEKEAASPGTKKKVLYVDSYHADLPWIKGITNGILKAFGGTVDDKEGIDLSKSLVDLKITHMDTKRNKSEGFKKNAAIEVKGIIESWKPDIVIASDDNASKYLIEPYYKGSDLPFVFCGVNWDASIYGFPYSNVTGMVEVQLIPQLVGELKRHSDGDRIGYIKSDTLSARQEAENYEKILGRKLEKRFLANYKDWQSAYISLQSEVDFLLVGNLAGLEGLPEDASEIHNFIFESTKIPTGSWDAWMGPYTLITKATYPEEQGEWAAKTVLEILDGKSPSDIAIVTNYKAKIILNMKLAKKLNIKFSMGLIEQATFAEEMNGR